VGIDKRVHVTIGEYGAGKEFGREDGAMDPNPRNDEKDESESRLIIG
jgi:hypothetical protein